MKIYVAGKFEAKARLRAEAELIFGLGHRVISSWLFAPAAPGRVTDAHLNEVMRDVEEVEECDLLILDTFDPSETGGREIEYGIALGLGIKRWVVGPLRSEFYLLATREFADWAEVHYALAEVRSAGGER